MTGLGFGATCLCAVDVGRWHEAWHDSPGLQPFVSPHRVHTSSGHGMAGGWAVLA